MFSKLLILIFTWCLFGASSAAFAQGNKYGVGHPKTVDELPNGKLKRQIQGLSAKARGKALGWLQGISFPKEDVSSLDVTPDGSVRYIDSFSVANGEVSSAEADTSAEGVSAADIFKLHSKPGSANVVYLDFDGHIITENAWNYYSEETLVALPFDPSNNDTDPTVANFTELELSRIHKTWNRVAEDYAAFDIDVTTEEPPAFTNTMGRVLITQNYDGNGIDMPGGGGGVAYVNAFGKSNYASYYNIALVYYQNLGGGHHVYVGEASSHEFGHNLGLSHDGIVDGSGYYQGHGSGSTSWAPIMGNAYYKNVTTWSKGEYANANNDQDDLSIIEAKLGYKADDHGDSAAQATALQIEADGSILVTSPESDPDNLFPDNKGIISDGTDTDWFSFDAAAGDINLTVTPGWYSFVRTDNRGSNLDVELSLYDANLNLVTIGYYPTETHATLAGTLTAGRYYLKVDGVGSANYSDYSSLGLFFIEGSIQGTTSEPPPPPANVAPTANFTYSCNDLSCSFNGSASADSDGDIASYHWGISDGTSQSGTSLSHSFAAAGSYNVQLTVTDNDGATGSLTKTISVTSPPPLPMDNKEPVAVVSYSPSPAVIVKGKSMDVTLNGSASSDADGNIVSYSWTNSSGTVVGSSSRTTVRLKAGTHSFTLTVTDNQGATNSADLSVSVTKSDGGSKPCRGKKCTK